MFVITSFFFQSFPAAVNWDETCFYEQTVKTAVLHEKDERADFSLSQSLYFQAFVLLEGRYERRRDQIRLERSGTYI